MPKKKIETTCKSVSKKSRSYSVAFDFKSLAEKWPSIVVARSEIKKFSGGLISPKTLANAQCKGIGPRSYRFGKKVFYHVDDLIKWMSELQGGYRK